MDKFPKRYIAPVPETAGEPPFAETEESGTVVPAPPPEPDGSATESYPETEPAVSKLAWPKKKPRRRLFRGKKEKPPRAEKREKGIPYKGIFTVIAYVLVIALLAGAPLMLIFNRGRPEAPAAQGPEGIIEIWCVEGFETLSTRAAFLSNTGIALNAVHKRLYTITRTVKAGQLETMLAESPPPDIITFSYGFGALVLPYAFEYSGAVSVRDDLLAAGEREGGVYALPWAYGGYAVIALEERLIKSGVTLTEGEAYPLAENIFSLGYTLKTGGKSKTVYSAEIGFGAFNSPLSAFTAVQFSTRAKNAVNTAVANTQYAAYEKYMQGGSAAILVGSQRDLLRLETRQTQNTLPSVRVEYLPETDLIEFASVTAASEAQRELAEIYLEYLMSAKAQGALTALGLFPANGRIYNSGFMQGLEGALQAKQKLSSAFISGDEAIAIRNAANASLAVNFQ